MSSLPPKHLRRLITLPGLTLVLILASVLTPVVLPMLLLIDGLAKPSTRGGKRDLRRSRLWLLMVSTAFTELGGAALGNLALIRFGWRKQHPGWFAGNERAQFWWVNRHLANVRRFAGVEIRVDNPEQGKFGNAIVLSHHASHIDALLPAWLFGPQGGLHIQYTLKDTLQWLPGMDLVAGNLPNVWIDRRPEPGSQMFTDMAELAASTDDKRVTVIFPEGTFYTPERLATGAARVAARRPDLEPLVSKLKHCLPIRPAGVMALLKGAPDADVAIVGHVGLEKFGFLSDIASNLPSPVPWEVHIWRFPRATIPTDDDELFTWLTERWSEMDHWIQERVAK